MKLLSCSFANHDANFSYFDGNQVHYIKAERPLQIKRVHIPIDYYEKFLWDTWAIRVADIDDVAINFDRTEETFCSKELSPLVRDDVCSLLHPLIAKTYNLKSAWFLPHHLMHAMSTWMLENDERAEISVVIDGLGDGRPWSVFDNKQQCIDKGNIKNGSIGWMMRDVGKQIGITANHQNDIAGKLMALQSFGSFDQKFFNLLKNYTIDDIKKIYDFKNWIEYKESELLANHTILDFINTIHSKTCSTIVELFKKHAPNKDAIISYSGGVAQNVVINTELKKEFSNLIIAPHSSDEGLSLGGIEWLRKKHSLPKFKIDCFPFAQSDQAASSNASIETIKKTALLLADNKTVAWYQAQGEIGARALGNRSIVFNPANQNGKKIVNKIKNREMYRPFGCSVLEDSFEKYFIGNKDYYMLLTSVVREQYKDQLQSITHIDGTCRVAVVNQQFNYVFYSLINEFYKLTNMPILLNTSLNVASRPIAGSERDAIDLFNSTEFLDAVVIGNKIIVR